jgi:hypothetical protein
MLMKLPYPLLLNADVLVHVHPHDAIETTVDLAALLHEDDGTVEEMIMTQRLVLCLSVSQE